jgi:hypothetical protein
LFPGTDALRWHSMMMMMMMIIMMVTMMMMMMMMLMQQKPLEFPSKRMLHMVMNSNQIKS